MKERKAAVTMKGKPLTLLGDDVQVGQKAADFSAVNQDMQNVKLSDFAQTLRIITTYPSLDTPVCDIMAKRFNEEAAKLGDDVNVLAISMDLPFAQKRWCAASDAQNIITLSDYKNTEFGAGYGVLIKELRLLARSIFIVDKHGVIRYKELVSEIADQPDYESAVKAVKELV
jgi:thiol peroxidase